MEKQPTIGIVGGGQLGRMLTLAAKPLGFHVVVLNTSPNSPASRVGAEEIIGDLYDAEALRKLAERVDHITAEIEHLNAEALEALAATGKPVHPAPATIKLIQDKYLQSGRSGRPVCRDY
jgi:5-(carboxyamino)imidazole ribonucleotide synthase